MWVNLQVMRDCYSESVRRNISKLVCINLVTVDVVVFMNTIPEHRHRNMFWYCTNVTMCHTSCLFILFSDTFKWIDMH